MVAVVLSGVSGIAMEARQQARPMPVFEDHFPPPPSVATFTRQVDAVARVMVGAATPGTELSPASGRSNVVTKYLMRVVDPIKPGASLPSKGETFTITQYGGEGIVDGRLIRVFNPNFEDFRVGAEYVLFPTWNRYHGEFDVAYGEDGAYELTAQGVVRPLGKAGLSRAVRGRDARALIEEIRAAATNGAPRR